MCTLRILFQDCFAELGSMADVFKTSQQPGGDDSDAVTV